MKQRPNANEIWEHLKSCYQKSDAVSSLYNYHQLHCTMLLDNGTLEIQINQLIHLHSCCALNGLKLKDYQFVATILIALPKSYSQIANSLLANGKIEDLMAEQVRVKILETKVHCKGETDSAANTIRQTGRLSSLKKKVPKGTCCNCGNKGHWVNKCPNKKPSNTPATTSPSPKDLLPQHSHPA